MRPYAATAGPIFCLTLIKKQVTVDNFEEL